jgi:CRP-like cAMP-binding protein
MIGPRLDDLRTIPLFNTFTDEALVNLAKKFERTTPREGGVLFEIGDPATRFFVLTAGEVALEVPGDDTFTLRPPALIGELGSIAGLPRNCRAVATPEAVIWALDRNTIQRFFVEDQELGMRFLTNLLEMVADKVHRDQRRLADMRTNLVVTQKSLKSLRDVILEAKDTAISSPAYDTLNRLIVHNRRVNYRVEPMPALASHLRLDVGRAPIVELSRTHVTAAWPTENSTVPPLGTWMTGVADLAGTEIPVSGKVMRSGPRNITIELDLLIDDSVTVLEGYLTRVQLLDILV